MTLNRTKEYIKRGKHRTSPILRKSDISNHPDNKIDQDFPGFPHGHSTESIIKPENETDEKTADVNNMDGEKRTKDTTPIDESLSDGSGGAFSAVEEVKE
jgi:hypothetical protein